MCTTGLVAGDRQHYLHCSFQVSVLMQLLTECAGYVLSRACYDCTSDQVIEGGFKIPIMCYLALK